MCAYIQIENTGSSNLINKLTFSTIIMEKVFYFKIKNPRKEGNLKINANYIFNCIKMSRFWREQIVNLANRYMELIVHYQAELKRELSVEEIQYIKTVVAKEYKENPSNSNCKMDDVKQLC